MSKQYVHSRNGKFFGLWHYLDSGRACYIAHRKAREIFHMKTAWCLDVATLEECRTRGVSYVGVRIPGKKPRIYLTLVEDFFTSPYSFPHFGDTRQRGLPLARFRINPSNTAKAIATAMKIK